jgi:hypothetical protein
MKIATVSSGATVIDDFSRYDPPPPPPPPLPLVESPPPPPEPFIAIDVRVVTPAGMVKLNDPVDV